MAIDIKGRIGRRALVLIKLAGVIDATTGKNNPTQPPHPLFMIAKNSQIALNSGDLRMILQACYQADPFAHIDKSQRSQYPSASLCPRGSIYMVSREATQFRNATPGRVIVLDVLQAAVGMEEGSYEVASAEQIREAHDARKSAMEELRLREEELHPEKAKPTVVLQMPDYSKFGNAAPPPGMMMVSKEDLLSMINEGVDARLKHLSLQSTNDGVDTGISDQPGNIDAQAQNGAADKYTVHAGEVQELTPEERHRTVEENLRKAKQLREQEAKQPQAKRG